MEQEKLEQILRKLGILQARVETLENRLDAQTRIISGLGQRIVELELNKEEEQKDPHADN